MTKSILRLATITTCTLLSNRPRAFAAETLSDFSLQNGEIARHGHYIAKKQPKQEIEVAGITLEASDLENVRSVFGAGEIYHEGDAGKSIYLRCFKGADGTILSFESGEMGGGAHTVLAIGLYGTGGDYRYKSHCIASTKVSKRLQAGVIHLDVYEADVEAALGEPSLRETGFVLYAFKSHERTGGVEYDVISSVEVRFSKKRVTQINMKKLSAN